MTALIFIIVLSILVFVHELGHFVMAKRAGMKVEEFGFGFPPRIFGIKRGGTTYSINWIPFGGFVKIMGEDGDNRNDPQSFGAKSLWSRTGVILAGVVMNFLFAVALLIIVNSVGLRVGLDNQPQSASVKDIKVQIIQVTAGSPAEKAGLKVLDEIVELKTADQDLQATDVPAVQAFIAGHKGQEIAMTLSNGNSLRTISVVPRIDPPAGEGALGIAMTKTGIVKYSLPVAFIKGFQYAAVIFVNTLLGYAMIIKNIFMTGKPGVEVSGPVGIASLTGQAARFGLIYLMQFMALISVNLAVLNVIPFPALDGGRFLFLIIEKIKGSPLSRRVEGTINSLGFIVLLALMLYITTKDILKFL